MNKRIEMKIVAILLPIVILAGNVDRDVNRTTVDINGTLEALKVLSDIHNHKGSK